MELLKLHRAYLRPGRITALKDVWDERIARFFVACARHRGDNEHLDVRLAILKMRLAKRRFQAACGRPA